jgi:hypothetical protein
MDTTQSDGKCRDWWSMNLYKDEGCEEVVDKEGPIENLLGEGT